MSPLGTEAGAAPATATAPRRRGGRWLWPFVPFVAGAHAGGLAASAVGLPSTKAAVVGGAVFVVVFAAVFLLGRALLRRPRAAVVVKVLVAAHVVFWSVLGWTRTQPREAGAVEAGIASVWQGEPRPFLAGVGEAAFGLTEADPIAGYGAFPRRAAVPWMAPGPLVDVSLGLMRGGGGTAPRVPMFVRGQPGPEHLGAKAIVLRPQEGKGSTLAICRLDLVLCEPRLRDAVLERCRGLGIEPATLWLCATHTHSGPGGFAYAPLAQAIATDHDSADTLGRIAKAAADAIRQAYDAAVPARIGFVRARDHAPDGRPALAENRAQDATPDRIDPEVLGIRLDALRGSKRIALLLAYGVHPTRWKPKETRFSQDVAGAIERSAGIADGASIVFVNGAVGDVKPRTDRVVPDPATGLLVVPEFEKAVARGLSEPAGDAKLRIAAAVARRDLGSPRYVHALGGERGDVLDVVERPFGSIATSVGTVLSLPLNAVAWSAGMPNVRLGASVAGRLGAVVDLSPWVETRAYPFAAIRLETESQVVALVGVPGEPTTAVGERLKDEMRLRGASQAFVVGLVGDYFAYCATADECAQGTYEGRFTLYGPHEADRVVEACEGALDAVGVRQGEPK